MTSVEPPVAARVRAVEAVHLLNDFVGDIVTAVQTWQHAPNILKNPKLLPMLNRMCVTHLILSLAKLTEFYDRYKAILPNEEADALKAVRKELAARGVLTLRNKVIGHIWDTDMRRPLTDTEVDACLAQVTKNNPDDFIDWVNGDTPQSMVNLIERARDRLIKEHEIKNKEIFV